jgi:hypothetical protein
MKSNSSSRKTHVGQQRSKSKNQLTDIPLAPRRDYSTASCRLPKISMSTTIHAMNSFTATPTAASDVAPIYNFRMIDANVGTGFYDQYMIEAIRFSIVPRQNAIGINSVAVSDLFCVIDYDDSAALTSANAAQAYATCVKLSPGESLERTFQPKMAIGAYGGTLFSSYANVKPMWIDSVSNTVPHYGIKCFIPATGSVGQTTFQVWDITCEFYIKLRNTL